MWTFNLFQKGQKPPQTSKKNYFSSWVWSGPSVYRQCKGGRVNLSHSPLQVKSTSRKCKNFFLGQTKAFCPISLLILWFHAPFPMWHSNMQIKTGWRQIEQWSEILKSITFTLERQSEQGSSFLHLRATHTGQGHSPVVVALNRSLVCCNSLRKKMWNVPEACWFCPKDPVQKNSAYELWR